MLRSRGGRAAAATLGYLLVAGIALHLLGVGGYRGGPVVVAAILGVGGAALAALVLGAGFSNRVLWSVTPLVIGFALSGPLSAAAPLSKGRLAERLDEVPLANFVEIDETRSGHSWCRPDCPEVERRYRGADRSPEVAVFDMAISLVSAGLLPEPPGRAGEPVFSEDIRAEGDDLVLVLSGERIDDRTEVTVRLRSKRR